MEENVREAQETEKGTGRTGAEAETDEERKFRRMVFHGWIIVFAIAALFVAYGFLAFFIIGDKGPPDWDYGSIRDVPAQSVYSTYPYSEHAGRPSLSMSTGLRQMRRSIGRKRMRRQSRK